MAERPAIAPELLAKFIDDAPSRLVRKLEKKPRLADDYSWSEAGRWTIETGKETVTLQPSDGVLSDIKAITCTCLLAPRCLHILATLSVLPVAVADSSVPPATVASESTPNDRADDEEPERLEPLTATQKEALQLLFDAGVGMLDQGAANATMTTLSELLRAVHSCRLEGMHRGARAGLRVVESTRALKAGSAAFDREALVRELTELFQTSYALLNGQDSRPLRGVARRKYRNIGGRKLVGLFAEPIASKTGYAGVVTYLLDARDGTFWTISDVRPGEPSRIPGAFRGGISIGDASMSPRELSRSGLFVQAATGSTDGRLGAGKDVKAVGIAPASWDASLGDTPWNTPLDDALDRVWQAKETPLVFRSPGADLVFLEATVVGAYDDALVLDLGDQRWVRCPAPLFNEHVAFVHNMRLLARVPGLRLRVIARVRSERRSTLELLAAAPCPGAPEDDAPMLTLPDDWHGRFSVGLDRLDRESFSQAETRPVDLNWPEARTPDPLRPLDQRIAQLAYGGRMTLRPALLDRVHREASALENHMMPHAAALLRELGNAAQPDGRSITGEARITDPKRLAVAWLAAALYARGAHAAIQRQTFLMGD